MPILQSVPSEDLGDQRINSSFTVINTDSLGIYGKPNAIVRPVRRGEPFESDSTGTTATTAELAPPNNQDPPSKNEFGKGTMNVDTNDQKEFSKELDLKLKKLQKENKHSSKNSSSEENIKKRPLFITTVPSGYFLQPELPPLTPARRAYAFFSIPRIFANKNKYIVSGTGEPVPVGTAAKITTTTTTTTATNVLTNRVEPLSRTPKQRDPCQSTNLMYNKRIVRGTNFSSNRGPIPWNPHFAYAGLLSGKIDDDCCQKEKEAQRRLLVRKRCSNRKQRGIIGTPPPVKGRKHENVQTEKYLEELFSRPTEYEASCQTELFLHRPPTPPYIPAKIGVDVVTEILEGELFDFDTEVEPILETLVGRSVEQALVEVMHEEELNDMRQQQHQLLSIREAELAELRCLEAEEIRLQAEKERRIKQEEIARALDVEMMERVTAAKLLQGHIADKLPGILTTLEPFVDLENRERLEKVLGPWLTKEVAEEVGQIIDSRELLEEIVREILQERAAKYASFAMKEFCPDYDEAIPEGEELREEVEGELDEDVLFDTMDDTN